MTPEQIAQLVTAVVTLAAAAAAYLESRKTTQVAREGKQAATEAKESADAVQQSTVDKLDYDRLRRMESALLTLPGCEMCRQQILDMTERRRLRPRLETPDE